MALVNGNLTSTASYFLFSSVKLDSGASFPFILFVNFVGFFEVVLL